MSSSSDVSDIDSDEEMDDSGMSTASSDSEKEETKEKPEEKKEELLDDPEKERFEQELEFVQCLANPRYLNSLVQRNYFGDPAFIKYIDYLQYWTKPEYAKYIKYTQSLHFLRLLQDPDFRIYISDIRNIMKIEDQQLFFWEVYRKNRLNLERPEPKLSKENDDEKEPSDI